MGLFSSKSKSKTTQNTTYTDNSVDVNNAASVGSLSSGNVIVGASGSYQYNEAGLTGDNLNSVLGTVETLHDTAQSTLSQTFDKMVGSVQKSAETAINTTAEAYAESDDELRRTIDGLRPIAMYAMLAAIAYFIFKGSK